MELSEIQSLIKKGDHFQFTIDPGSNVVFCRCGRIAIFFKTGYLCGSITAYPFKFNYEK